jgi:hypothetical protein
MSPQRATSTRRLVRLGTGELVAAAVFAVVAARGVAGSPGAAPAVWSALIPLLAVLVQAGVYWLVRSRARRLPAGMVATYRVFRVLDSALLVLGLAGVVRWWPAEPLVAAVVVAVWLFGVVEYLNYFVVRLAYPPAHWLSEVGHWRTPRLVSDLNR